MELGVSGGVRFDAGVIRRESISHLALNRPPDFFSSRCFRAISAAKWLKRLLIMETFFLPAAGLGLG
jgi:hypothetical protein